MNGIVKGWDVAQVDGHCSFDRDHPIAAGDDVFVYRGPTWRKVYCRTCALQPHHDGANAGLLPPPVLAPLPMPVQAGLGFDARRAAANDRDVVGPDPDDDLRFDPRDWETP